MGDSLFGMGAIARDFGLISESLEFFQKAIQLYNKSLGDSHVITTCACEEYEFLDIQNKDQHLNSDGNDDVINNNDSNSQNNMRRNNNSKKNIGSHQNSNNSNFKFKTHRDNSPQERLSKISEHVSTPKSKLSNQVRPSNYQSNLSQNGSNSFNRGGNNHLSFSSVNSSNNNNDKDRPRTTAPPIRRRPETARTSWDMDEADYHSSSNPIQIDENPEDDIMKFLFNENIHLANECEGTQEGEEDGGDGGGGNQAQMNLNKSKEGILTLPSISDIMKKAVQTKGLKNIKKKSHTKSSQSSTVGHSSEILFNKLGRPIAILSGGFEESYSF